MIRRVLSTMLLLLLATAFAPSAGAEIMNVLFIGNSHTYYNDLPNLFHQLASAGGQAVYVDDSTMGGQTLEGHSTHPTTLAKIAERNWDYVVLQEHSLYPVIEHLREKSFYPAARTLDSLIAAQGSTTSLFMTWGWENGGEFCIDGHCSPVFPDYGAMQASVTAAYGTLADELGAFLVPVGILWATALHADPSSPLWNGDHYHPSPEGSYLAACVFFTRFFGISPEGLDYHGNIDPERALFYQQIAGRLVTTGAPDAPTSEWGGLRLLPAHPNPFSAGTTLSFELGRPSSVLLEFYDPRGRLIDRMDLGARGAGTHSISWNGAGAVGGVQFYRISTDSGSRSGKLMLLH